MAKPQAPRQPAAANPQQRAATSPSTSDSKDAAQRVDAVVEAAAVRSSGTHSVVKGQVAPRLPHERDESSDSGTGAPTAVMHKAAQDAASGQTDHPRGPQSQQHYSTLTQDTRERTPKK